MDQTCPECSEELSFDEVDIGLGTLKGNWRCDFCGWTLEEMRRKQLDYIMYKEGSANGLEKDQAL